MLGFRPFACLCLLWAVLATTVGGPPNRVSGVARAMDDLTPDRFGRRDRASLSLDGVERRKLVGRLVVDKKEFPEGIALGYRARNAREMTLVPTGPLSEGSNTIPLSLPLPWRGELHIAHGGTPQRGSFVGVAVEPVVPSHPRDFVYGPAGRSQVLLPAGVPLELRYLVFISPSMAALPDAGLVDEPVEIACLARDARVKEALVGLTPLASSKKPMSLSVYDHAQGRWKTLRSHTASTGTVFARGPVPGTYAVTEEP